MGGEMEPDLIEQRLRLLLAEHTGLAPEGIDPNLPLLRGGFELDSLTMASFVTAVQQEFGVDLLEEDLGLDSLESLAQIRQEGSFRYWIEQDGMRYAGRHLVVDLWGAKNLDRLEVVRGAVLDAIRACGASLIDLNLHHFLPNGGITGAAVLSQSHLCIHTWPEEGFAAIDLFVCGPHDPTLIMPALQAAFTPERVEVHEHRRGLLLVHNADNPSP